MEGVRRDSEAPAQTSGWASCLIGCFVLLLISPALLWGGFAVADLVAFNIDGGCVPPPFTLDACRSSRSFSVWNRTDERVSIFAVDSGGSEQRLGSVSGGYSTDLESYTIVGKCDGRTVFLVRTTAGIEIARKVGMCRREMWTVGAPNSGPS